MSSDLLIKDTSVARTIKVGTTENVEEKAIDSFYTEFSKSAYFETGILPLDGSGVLSIRQAFNRQQIVFQHVPGVYYIIWGKSEGSSSAKTYLLAQPYRIVIGDLVDGQLRGARHFYSPIPISSLEQPLYHCNVPNLNTQGYNGTSVGWICLYKTENYNGLTLGQKIFKVVERASGHEAYNDANMSSTDGTRLYQKVKNSEKYLWDPAAWQAKSEKEGFEWTLNPDLWIPVQVAGIDSQKKHDNAGPVLTLEMAMYGNYQAYYPSQNKDEDVQTPMNIVARKLKGGVSKEVKEVFNKSFLGAAKKEEPAKPKLQKVQANGITGGLLKIENSPPPKVVAPSLVTPQPVQPPVVQALPTVIGSCYCCDNQILSNELHHLDAYGHKICPECKTEWYSQAACCNTLVHAEDSFFYTPHNCYYCWEHHSLEYCDSCGTEYLDSPESILDMVCIACAQTIECDMCHAPTLQVHAVTAAKPLMPGIMGSADFMLCPNCVTASKICACGMLQAATTVVDLPDGSAQNVCEGCINYNPDGSPVYVSFIKGVQ